VDIIAQNNVEAAAANDKNELFAYPLLGADHLAFVSSSFDVDFLFLVCFRVS
jgi:hypothetical protein